MLQHLLGISFYNETKPNFQQVRNSIYDNVALSSPHQIRIPTSDSSSSYYYTILYISSEIKKSLVLLMHLATTISRAKEQ